MAAQSRQRASGPLFGADTCDVPVAGQALRKLLAEPMRFEPVELDGKRTYRITGKTKVGALLAGDHIRLASPRGGHLIPQLRTTSYVTSLF